MSSSYTIPSIVLLEQLVVQVEKNQAVFIKLHLVLYLEV